MAFRKISKITIDKKIIPLNKPNGWDFFNLPNSIKTASSDNFSAGDVNGFDIKKAISEYPDHLFIKMFAIKKDEPNDNGDAFSEDELKKSAHTFVGVPLFTNHQNDDIEKARGICVHSWYDDADGGIYIIGRVDKVAYPDLSRAIEQKYVVATSMGTSVTYALCSICHNKATSADEFCSHISGGKNRKFSGSIKCQYHNNKDVKPDEKCPVCGSTGTDVKVIKHSDSKIYEHNYGLNFIENSFVVNPACHDCGIREIFNVSEVKNKVASLKSAIGNIYKVASKCDNDIKKIGGVKELDALKNSMNEMEFVVRSMLDQKENVSIAYVEDITEAMKKVQETYDELVEMGYASLPSSNINTGASQPEVATSTSTAPGAASGGNFETNNNQSLDGYGLRNSGYGASQNSNQVSPEISSYEMDGLGSVTMPKKSSDNKEDFLKYNKILIDKVASLDNSINWIINKMNNTDQTGDIMDSKEQKSNLEKVAANADNREIITEKQLEKGEESLHPRTNSSYEGITESKEQLGGNVESNDTTSSSPQVRMGNYETITEDQLSKESFLGDSIIRFDDTPEVITEKQWTEINREAGANISNDYTSQITEAQIRNLLDNHKFVGQIDTITEDQLNKIDMNKGMNRWANTEYATEVVKVACNTVADMISMYKKSPMEIGSVVSEVNDNYKVKEKIARLSAYNSLPNKNEDLEKFSSNVNYFNRKNASIASSVSLKDALILSMAKNASFGIKADDVLNSISSILSNKKAMKQVDKIIDKKSSVSESTVAQTNIDGVINSVVDKMDYPEDGKFRIFATVEDLDSPISDKVAFCNSLKKYATEMIDNDSIDAKVVSITIKKDNGEIIIDIEDGAETEITPDDIDDVLNGTGDANEGELETGVEGEGELVVEDVDSEDDIYEDSNDDGEIFANKSDKSVKKIAQMMGGNIGNQGGVDQGPGAGAQLPNTGGDPGMPPMESFTEADDAMGEVDDFGTEGEPLPPGSRCPVCGSEDVDVVEGKAVCNNCASEFDIKIELNVTKWKGITDGEKNKEGVDEEFEGKGLDISEADEMAGAEQMEQETLPAAASTDNGLFRKVALMTEVNKDVVTKMYKDKKINFGSISPISGEHHTISLGDGEYMCLATGQKYKVSFALDKNNKKIFAQWEWNPIDNNKCESCKRARGGFVKSLKLANITEEKFNNMSFDKKIETIGSMRQAGYLRPVKIASKQSDSKYAMSHYKKAYYVPTDKFPIETCIEKIARRFGEDAICLSGPDEGKNLAESVCRRMRSAQFYTDKTASIIADRWNDCDGDDSCVDTQHEAGYTMAQSRDICSALKLAVAFDEDLMVSEFNDDIENQEFSDSVDTFEEEVDGGDIDSIDDVDPFDSENNVTITLPLDVIEKMDKEFDKALGENPEEEEHHSEEFVEDISEEDNVENVDDIEIVEDVDEDVSEGEIVEMEDNDIKTPCCSEDNDGIMEGDETVFEEDLTKEKGDFKNISVNYNGEKIANDNEERLYKEARDNMGIQKTGKISLDLSGVLDVINKKAEKEVKQKNVQNVEDIKPYSDGENGGMMGHEKETIPSTSIPGVPRNKATMGEEKSDANPEDKPQPNIPNAPNGGSIGKEDLDGGNYEYTGGNDGAGKSETENKKASTDEDYDLMHMRGYGNSRESWKRIADSVLKSVNKSAGNKKLEPKKPVSDDKDIAPISDGGTIGKEEKFDAEKIDESKIKSDSGMIGKEKESLGEKPDSPKSHPEVFTGESQMGEEELDSEKTTKDKGTVIAKSESESEAYRVAARMLEGKIIESSQLQSKVTELKSYKPEQIRDFEKSIFASKGLDASDGLSLSVQEKGLAKGKTLTDKLTSMFSLAQRNDVADSDENIQLRKTYNK